MAAPEPPGPGPSRIGLLGGSFDPPHRGHLAVADRARQRLDLDEVRLIPAAAPPHKRDRVLAPPEVRLHMLELLAAERPFLRVDDRELRRGGTSYTVDTVTELRGELPDAELYFLIGSDSLRELHQWYRVQELLEEVTFVTVPRDPALVPALRQEARQRFPGEAGERLARHVLDVDAVVVSSTEVRAGIATGAELRGLVPDAIADYLTATGLYS